MRILLVEDDVEVRQQMAEVLAASGHTVHVAADGEQAMQSLIACGPSPPTLILCDLMMPVMDGRRFVTVLRSYLRFADIPVVIVSGTEEVPRVGRQLYQRYVRKPLSSDALLAIVAEFDMRTGASQG